MAALGWLELSLLWLVLTWLTVVSAEDDGESFALWVVAAGSLGAYRNKSQSAGLCWSGSWILTESVLFSFAAAALRAW
jgi:hypothetical protein